MPTAELWRTAYGHPDYEVSSLGRVRRATAASGTTIGTVLLPRKTRYGYPYLNLSSNCVRTQIHVHKMVAETFIGPRPDGYVINHKNAVRDDNRPENLEYVTQKDNVTYGSGHYESRLNEQAVRIIRFLHRKHPRRGLRSLFARLHGVTNEAVYNAVSGKKWQRV